MQCAWASRDEGGWDLTRTRATKSCCRDLRSTMLKYLSRNSSLPRLLLLMSDGVVQF